MTVHMRATSGKEEGINRVLLNKTKTITKLTILGEKDTDPVTFEFSTEDFFSHLKFLLRTHNRVDLTILNDEGSKTDEMFIEYKYKNDVTYYSDMIHFSYLGFAFQVNVDDVKVLVEELYR